MIDFKNYERVTNSNDYNNVCDEVSCNFDCENCYLGKRSIRLAELEDMIEQGKLVEKSEPKTAKERVALELKQLEERQQKLYDFIQTIKFQELSSIQKDLLVQQNNIMVDYIGTLENRLGNWEEL